MVNINPNDLWFNTPDTDTLCRGGGNGPNHPSQLYAIKKYVKLGMTFLDYGCGSGTTYEAWLEYQIGHPPFDYKGVDIIPKNVEWCQKQWPLADFEVNPSLHKIDQPDKSFDVVYSRHVVDHMKSFEEALDEHKRVSKKLVIVVLWVPLSTSDDHQIKNIVDQGKVYEDEYTNSYSKKRVLEYLNNDIHWKLLELTEEVGSEVSGHNTVIVLERNES